MTIQVEHRRVEDLIPYARNSRTHSDAQVAQIAASIREFGWTNPVLIDGVGGIIAGHGRLLAARQLGLAEVPCIVLDHLSETQKRALIIADNKLALNAGWDNEMLRIEVVDLGESDFDLTIVGFSDADMAGVLDRSAPLADMPTIPSEDRQPFQNMTFTLHDDQVATVRAAMSTAGLAGAYGESLNANGNGNALTRICEDYQARHGDG